MQNKPPSVFISRAMPVIFTHGSYVCAYPNRKFPEDIKYTPKEFLDKAIECLEKIRDPRKRHSEPDKYTELACVMNMADECLKEITYE